MNQGTLSDGFGVKVYTFLPNSAGTTRCTQLTATPPTALFLISIVVASSLQGVAKPLQGPCNICPSPGAPRCSLTQHWQFHGTSRACSAPGSCCSEQASCMCQVLRLDIVVLPVTVDSRCFGNSHYQQPCSRALFL